MKKYGKVLFPLLYSITYPIVFIVINCVLEPVSEFIVKNLPQFQLEEEGVGIVIFIGTLILWPAVIGGWCSYRYARAYLREGKYQKWFLIYGALFFSLFPAGWVLIFINPFLYIIPFLWCWCFELHGMESPQKDTSSENEKKSVWNKKYVKKEPENPKDENISQE